MKSSRLAIARDAFHSLKSLTRKSLFETFSHHFGRRFSVNLRCLDLGVTEKLLNLFERQTGARRPNGRRKVRLAQSRYRATRLKMNQLLSDDHAELDSLLNDVFAALDECDAQRAFRKLDSFWARLAMHIRAEHMHLLPAILGAIETQTKLAENVLPPSLRAAQDAISELREDHDFFMRELSGAIKQLRGLHENRQTEGEITQSILSVREAVAAVSRHLEKHNQKEESEIYEWAGRLLNQPECAALNERMKKEIENLPPRFGDKKGS